jgi:prophage antirepressor-like protein
MALVFDAEARQLRMGDATARVHVRTVDGEPRPWFQARPIVVHLGYTSRHVHQTLSKLPEKHRKSLGELMEGELSDSSLTHNERTALYVSEPGLYELLCKSEMPAARPFQDWVYEEVLPQIRRTGGYSLAQPSAQQQLAELHAEMPQLVDQAVAQALPAIQQAIVSCHSHHIFEASHGGSSSQDQALLREVGRDAALEWQTFLAEEPLELGAFLREQLPASDHWKVARIKVSFAIEAKARALVRHEEQGTRPWLVYSQGALRIAYTAVDCEHLLLQFWEDETQQRLAAFTQGAGSAGNRGHQSVRVREGPYSGQATIDDFFRVGRAAIE